MTPLASELARQIAATGPIPLNQFMAACLTHPVHGYYTGRDPLGAAGDFTTAPEISQMFGELLGLSLAQAWLDRGAPNPFLLTELGPGRGTLMADVMRATKSVLGFHDAARLHLVEVSEPLRAAQAKTLQPHTPTWHDTIADLPDGPLFLIANEYFDALPIRQFQRLGDGWSEKMVALDDTGAPCFGWSPPAPLADLAHRLDDTQEGDIVEVNLVAAQDAGLIAGRIAAHGGAAILVDYGDWRSLGDTLQSVRNHEPEHPLANPGNADLTAQTDFEPLALAATKAGAAHSRVTPQGLFLERLGITARAQALAANFSGPALEAHIAAHRRLTHPEGMGTLFKVMSIHPIETAPPPGLDP